MEIGSTFTYTHCYVSKIKSTKIKVFPNHVILYVDGGFNCIEAVRMINIIILGVVGLFRYFNGAI